ncbi:small acid-soluble spore protein H (minor) [Evansella vedderi]|uniref:Small, acid-soluble spore protein H n=1 Tax=Evansella vedderi TaxID=38282 RepID=A0ABU0A0F8_9BACI|nr:small acid-soluble spore protein H [Evansella vedderi]MDQ0256965.1 small acid-soluble spore protein H (minor) [Evansella vedderi]
MNVQRAKEIAQSPDMKDVKYNGQRVYIQHVDDQNATARVYPLEDPQNEQEVQVDNLIEE